MIISKKNGSAGKISSFTLLHKALGAQIDSLKQLKLEGDDSPKASTPPPSKQSSYIGWGPWYVNCGVLNAEGKILMVTNNATTTPPPHPFNMSSSNIFKNDSTDTITNNNNNNSNNNNSSNINNSNGASKTVVEDKGAAVLTSSNNLDDNNTPNATSSSSSNNNDKSTITSALAYRYLPATIIGRKLTNTSNDSSLANSGEITKEPTATTTTTTTAKAPTAATTTAAKAPAAASATAAKAPTAEETPPPNNNSNSNSNSSSNSNSGNTSLNSSISSSSISSSSSSSSNSSSGDAATSVFFNKLSRLLKPHLLVASKLEKLEDKREAKKETQDPSKDTAAAGENANAKDKVTSPREKGSKFFEFSGTATAPWISGGSTQRSVIAKSAPPRSSFLNRRKDTNPKELKKEKEERSKENKRGRNNTEIKDRENRSHNSDMEEEEERDRFRNRKYDGNSSGGSSGNSRKKSGSSSKKKSNGEKSPLLSRPQLNERKGTTSRDALKTSNERTRMDITDPTLWL